MWFFVWWIGLGVASSIGLGTGLHTFLIYTMPFIIRTGHTALGCKTLNFPTSGPEAFQCPAHAYEQYEITLWALYTKVALPVFLWGIGTALGELPPFFVSRAARLAGDRIAELDELADPKQSLADRVKVYVYEHLQKHGFITILLMASVPNPMFDLAGITCGHFLIPFWTFFGATLIGKAAIKSTGQALFICYVIVHADYTILESMFKSQQGLLHHVWEVFIIAVVGFFLLSIANAAVHERLTYEDERRIEEFQRKQRLSKYANIKLLAD